MFTCERTRSICAQAKRLDDYTSNMHCKRPAGVKAAIEDMDWSWMNQDYVCFTEDFDADAEISELCDDAGQRCRRHQQQHRKI